MSAASAISTVDLALIALAIASVLFIFVGAFIGLLGTERAHRKVWAPAFAIAGVLGLFLASGGWLFL